MKRTTGRKGGGEGIEHKIAYQRKKICRFCVDKNLKIDYKDAGLLQYFVTERGKIIPRRISGNCARHQREITRAIKRARNVALVPYTTPIE